MTGRFWRSFWDGFLTGLASPILLITGEFFRRHKPREQGDR